MAILVLDDKVFEAGSDVLRATEGTEPCGVVEIMADVMPLPENDTEETVDDGMGGEWSEVGIELEMDTEDSFETLGNSTEEGTVLSD